jgi:hypothetical protein
MIQPAFVASISCRLSVNSLTALSAKIVSIKGLMGLSKVQGGRAIRRSTGTVFSNLAKFKNLEKEIQGNVPEEKKWCNVNRLLQKKKLENLRHIYTRRGRLLKCEKFPDLTGILEFAFGDEDRVNRGGGGLESQKSTNWTLKGALCFHCG